MIKCKEVEFGTLKKKIYSRADSYRVCIYRYDDTLDIVEEIARGNTLKEACENWLKTEDISENLFTNFEHYIETNGIDINSSPCELAHHFDEFLKKSSGEEIFAFLAQDVKHNYVEWYKL